MALAHGFTVRLEYCGQSVPRYVVRQYDEWRDAFETVGAAYDYVASVGGYMVGSTERVRRVQLAPHLDTWMRGDRYGTLTRGASGGCVWVRMDRSGRTIRVAGGNVTEVTA